MDDSQVKQTDELVLALEAEEVHVGHNVVESEEIETLALDALEVHVGHNVAESVAREMEVLDALDVHVGHGELISVERLELELASEVLNDVGVLETGELGACPSVLVATELLEAVGSFLEALDVVDIEVTLTSDELEAVSELGETDRLGVQVGQMVDELL